MKIDPIREIREKEFIEMIAEKNRKDFKKFDLTMSGCSGTIVIQTPRKIFLAWVGDSHAILCKKERLVLIEKLTQ